MDSYHRFNHFSRQITMIHPYQENNYNNLVNLSQYLIWNDQKVFLLNCHRIIYIVSIHKFIHNMFIFDWVYIYLSVNYFDDQIRYSVISQRDGKKNSTSYHQLVTERCYTTCYYFRFEWNWKSVERFVRRKLWFKKLIKLFVTN